MDNYVKGVKVIEIYDAANKELLVKYDDKHNIDKVISDLNIKSWKETEKSIEPITKLIEERETLHM